MGSQMKVTTTIDVDGQSFSHTKTVTGDSSHDYPALAIAADAVDEELLVDLDPVQSQGYVLVSDRELTIKTNNSGTPDDTFVLYPDTPRVYFIAQSGQGVVTEIIDKIFVTNDSEVAGTLRIFSIENVAPPA